MPGCEVVLHGLVVAAEARILAQRIPEGDGPAIVRRRRSQRQVVVRRSPTDLGRNGGPNLLVRTELEPQPGESGLARAASKSATPARTSRIGFAESPGTACLRARSRGSGPQAAERFAVSRTGPPLRSYGTSRTVLTPPSGLTPHRARGRSAGSGSVSFSCRGWARSRRIT
jgi:hypothetical protein